MSDVLDIPALLGALKQTQVIEFFTQMRSDLTAAQQAIVQQAGIINQHSAVIQQQQAILNDLPNTLATAIGSNNTLFVTPALQQLLQTILGGTLPGTLDSLAELVAQLKLDEAGADAMLASLNQLKTTVTTLTNNLAAVKSTADASAATIGNATTGLAAAHDGLTKRLRKDQADATTFPLSVPKAQDMGNAVQKSELVGGIQRPYRVFQNVGAAPVGAYVRTGQVAQVTDALALGQVWAITAVRVKTITSPTISSAITITNGSTTIFTTTVLLANLPVVGKMLDLLTLTGTSLPADVPLPATLQCSATGGAVFEIIIDGLLK